MGEKGHVSVCLPEQLRQVNPVERSKSMIIKTRLPAMNRWRASVILDE